jgi:hypothetical protein
MTGGDQHRVAHWYRPGRLKDGRGNHLWLDSIFFYKTKIPSRTHQFATPIFPGQNDPFTTRTFFHFFVQKVNDQNLMGRTIGDAPVLQLDDVDDHALNVATFEEREVVFTKNTVLEEKAWFPSQGSEPKSAISGLIHRKNLVVGHAMGSIVVAEVLPIKAANANVGTDPNVTLAVLKYGIDVIGQQPVLDLVVFKKRLLGNQGLDCKKNKPQSNNNSIHAASKIALFKQVDAA